MTEAKANVDGSAAFYIPTSDQLKNAHLANEMD